MTTFEEARRCPKCQVPGEEIFTTKAPQGQGVVHTIRCHNTRCEWAESDWIVQTRADGTIPDQSGYKGPKKYPELTPDQLAAGQRMMEDIARRDHPVD